MADTKPPRSPERASAVIERAARMKQFRASLADKRIGDPQMRNPASGPAPFQHKFLPVDHLKGVGDMDVPLDKIRSDQPTVSIAAVKSKIANPDGRPPQLIRHQGIYYVHDGNHRVTAARAKGEITIRAKVADLNTPEMKVGGAKSTAAGIVGAGAAATLTVANGMAAYADAKRHGASGGEAATEAAKAMGATAAMPAAFALGTGIAAKAGGLPGKLVLQVAGKAALPLAMAGTAAYYGYKAFKDGGGPADVTKAAAWGAVNGAVPVDDIKAAVDTVRGSGPVRLTESQKAAFVKADQGYDAGQVADTMKTMNGEPGVFQGGRGFQNPNNQAAAQKAKGREWKGATR